MVGSGRSYPPSAHFTGGGTRRRLTARIRSRISVLRRDPWFPADLAHLSAVYGRSLDKIGRNRRVDQQGRGQFPGTGRGDGRQPTQGLDPFAIQCPRGDTNDDSWGVRRGRSCARCCPCRGRRVRGRHRTLASICGDSHYSHCHGLQWCQLAVRFRMRPRRGHRSRPRCDSRRCISRSPDVSWLSGRISKPQCR